MRHRGRAAALLAALVATAGAASTCKRHQAASTADTGEVPVAVRPDSQGLLLTWIDDKGDFHVETRVEDVPMMGRDTVRVVDPSKEATQGDRIFVVDLRQTRSDGTYPVRSMARADFEALAVARREKTGPTLGGAAPPPASTAQPPPASEPGATKPTGRPLVVIYGAEWCGACHDAAKYLRSKGIAYIEKDVEKDPAAAREMEQKLARNGLRSGSIPVIDVRGKVMVGYNPAEIDAALGEAL